MTVLATLLYSIGIILQKVLSFLFPFFLLLLLFVIIRMIYRHKKYGYDYFDVFKKREEIDAFKAGILHNIYSLDPNAKVKEENQIIFAMTSIGLFCITLFPINQAHISGNVEEKTLTYSKDGTKKKVLNPFYLQDLKINQLKKEYDFPIYGYVIFDTISIVSLKGKSISKLIRKNQFYFQLEKEIKEKPHYKKEEIDFYFHQLLKENTIEKKEGNYEKR